MIDFPNANPPARRIQRRHHAPQTPTRERWLLRGLLQHQSTLGLALADAVCQESEAAILTTGDCALLLQHVNAAIDELVRRGASFDA